MCHCLSNEEIIVLLQESFNEKLFEELFSRFIPMYHKWMNQLPIISFDLQDYYQEARICLLKVINTFVCSEYHYVAGYFSKIYQNHLINIQRQYHAKKRQGEQNVVSIHESFTTKRVNETCFEDIICEQGQDIFEIVATKEVLLKFICSLSDLESEVIRHKLCDEDNRACAIADKMQISVRSVENAIARFRIKLKKYLDQDNLSNSSKE